MKKPEPEKHLPNGKPVSESAGQNPFWPGDALLKPGLHRQNDKDNDADDNEITIIPEVR